MNKSLKNLKKTNMKKHLYLISCLSVLLILILSKNLVAQPGAALHFDGYDDRIEMQGLNLTGAFTIEAWVKPSEKSDFSTILSNKFGGYEMNGFSFAINTYGSSDGKLYLETQLASVVSSASVTWDVWQHVAITYDGLSSVKMYINGAEIGTDIASTINLNASTYPTVIGDWSVYYGNGKYSGTMDEVRVWSYARCKLEILAQMNCELIGNEGGLLAYYNFNQGLASGNNSGATTLNDIAGADNNGSLQSFTLNGGSSNWVSPGGVVSGRVCSAYSNQGDDDCDGISNTCDLCPGGNDKVDNNHDGRPDCKYPPATQTELVIAWKCGNSDKKVLVCHKGKTLCVDYLTLADHLSHGDYIGPCGNTSCVNGINIYKNQLIRSEFLASGEMDINTFPNPSTYEFQLSINNAVDAEEVSVKVTDVQGRLLYLQQGSSNLTFRFGSDFASGIYLLEVNYRGEREVRKLVKN